MSHKCNTGVYPMHVLHVYNGDVAEMHRITRAQYHRAIRNVMKNWDIIGLGTFLKSPHTKM